MGEASGNISVLAGAGVLSFDRRFLRLGKSQQRGFLSALLYGMIFSFLDGLCRPVQR